MNYAGSETCVHTFDRTYGAKLAVGRESTMGIGFLS